MKVFIPGSCMSQIIFKSFRSPSPCPGLRPRNVGASNSGGLQWQQRSNPGKLTHFVGSICSNTKKWPLAREFSTCKYSPDFFNLNEYSEPQILAASNDRGATLVLVSWLVLLDICSNTKKWPLALKLSKYKYLPDFFQFEWVLWASNPGGLQWQRSNPVSWLAL